MRRLPWMFALILLAPALVLAESATLSVEDGMGPSPKLPAPVKSLLPTVEVAPVKPWGASEAPTAGGPDLRVGRFASGLDHPRWLHVLPNGDVLVAETNGPDRPDEKKGVRGFMMKRMMEKAGAGAPSADRLTLLRDADRDGIAETRTVFAQGLYSPFGMALSGDRLYVANADAVVRFPYKPGQDRAEGAPQKVADLPGGPRNHHWTKGLIASVDGRKLYASVGSNSNVAEHGLELEKDRAAILEIDAETGKSRVFASGLRNPVGMAWEPVTGALWVAVNERDEIGSDLVPDYMTSVKDGGFYGWPWSWYGSHVDERVKPARPDMVATAIVPDYALGAHTAALGLSNAVGNKLPERFAQGMFVGLHGSWNRDPPSGYKVIFVAFEQGRPKGMPVDVLTGFLDAEGHARGRPVGVAIDAQGGLLVADDVGGIVWRVSAAQAAGLESAAGNPMVGK
ncbi:MAG TPA: sorbosone dehydrogenase family protein [Nevskiaceae bacterium]|nr:sorbosone dehydrogenase family protein [Nevskiaceae bacterium]